MMTRFCGISVLVVVIALLNGCGGSGHPSTAPAGGIVYLNDQPLENANVVFYSADGRSAQGKTDASGRFQLSTFDVDDGAIVGEHTATVTVAPAVTEEADGSESEVLASSEIPKIAHQFTMPNTSPLKYTVEAGKTNEFELRVTSE